MVLVIDKNKDENIHKSEALKSKGRTKTLTLVECQNLIRKMLIYKCKLNLLPNCIDTGYMKHELFGAIEILAYKL